MGFRGKEISYSENDFVVILLGDSEVYAAASPFEQIPERRLEFFLHKYNKNVKVFTLADMGYGQDQQYLALKKYYEKFRADLVLLMFTARNDIANNIFPTAGGNSTIKPTFWLEDGELRGPSENWLEPVGSRLKLLLLWGAYFGKTSGELRNNIWEEKILPPPYKPLSDYQGEINYSWQQDWDSKKRKDIQNAINEISCIGVLSPRSERMQYGLDLTLKLILKMKELVEINNGHFIVFKEERPITESFRKERNQVYYLNGKYYKMSLQQIQVNMNYLLREFEHYRIPLQLENHRMSPSDSHLNTQAREYLLKKLSVIISKKIYSPMER